MGRKFFIFKNLKLFSGIGTAPHPPLAGALQIDPPPPAGVPLARQSAAGQGTQSGILYNVEQMAMWDRVERVAFSWASASRGRGMGGSLNAPQPCTHVTGR